MLCPNCKKQITKEDKFCKNCGQKIKTCPFCHKNIKPSKDQCPYCKRVLIEKLDKKEQRESEQKTNICPFCHRSIEFDKEKCPHCNRILIEKVSKKKEKSYQKKTKSTSKGGPMHNLFSFKIDKLRKYAVIFIGIIILLWLFSGDTPNTENNFPENDSTAPEEVLRNTQGEFTLEEYNPITFEEYYELEESVQEESIDLPLEYMEFESCEGKNTYIDFEETKYSEYKFNYQGKTLTYEIRLFPDLYEFSKNLKSQDCYLDYKHVDEMYFKDPYNNYFMKAVSTDFIELRERGYSKDEIIEIATIFVQSIPYNIKPGENNQYPYETFYMKEGGCSGKSVILAGILKNIGYTTYIVTTHEDKDFAPHALVGIVCDNGSVTYMGKDICFIEVTKYEPIGIDINIGDVEEYYKVSSGHLVYSEENYGKELSNHIEELWYEIERKEFRVESTEEELRELEGKMCNTDCETCYLDSDGEHITISNDTCYDAHQYNRYVEIYNQKYQNYEFLFEELYKDYYKLDEAIFWND